MGPKPLYHGNNDVGDYVSVPKSPLKLGKRASSCRIDETSSDDVDMTPSMRKGNDIPILQSSKSGNSGYSASHVSHPSNVSVSDQKVVP